jgi:hypothetical protein
MFWLPQPLYTAKPLIFLLAALSLMLITKNVIVTLFAICLIGYALWIFFVRFTWKDTGLVK